MRRCFRLQFRLNARRVRIVFQSLCRLESAHACYSIINNDLFSARLAARAGFPCRVVRSSEPSRCKTWTARLFHAIMKLFVRNFETFQHYKRRRPPWIKLHRVLLDDREFQSLPDASARLAPMLWLLSTEKSQGVIDFTIDGLAWRLRKSESWIESALQPLIDAGFFVQCKHAACKVLAECLQHATPETETETETEYVLGSASKMLAGCLQESKTQDASNGRNYRAEAKELLQFLNEKSHKKFREVDANLDLIIARLKSGASVEICRTMIMRKVRDWSTDPDMAQFLRPETLFRKSKFESYLAEVMR